jgi:nitrogen fixation protein NifB
MNGSGEMAKIAIASTDGKNIDGHFGQTREFLIYELSNDGSYHQTDKLLIDEIDDERAKLPHGIVHYVAKSLKENNVTVVLVGQIGPKAVDIVRKYNILALGVSGEIEKALVTFAKRQHIINRAFNVEKA